MKNQPDWQSLKDYASFGYDGQKPAISLREYALSKFTPELLVAITTLFFSEFVMHEQGVFFADRFSVALYNSWNRGRYKNDISAIERVINHVHLAESFGNGFQQLNKQGSTWVARR